MRRQIFCAVLLLTVSADVARADQCLDLLAQVGRSSKGLFETTNVMKSLSQKVVSAIKLGKSEEAAKFKAELKSAALTGVNWAKMGKQAFESMEDEPNSCGLSQVEISKGIADGDVSIKSLNDLIGGL